MRVLNAFMLHGLSLREILEAAATGGCQGVSVEPDHLSDPEIDVLSRFSGLKVTAAGSVFLKEDDPESLLSSVERWSELASAHGAGKLCVVLQSDMAIKPEVRIALFREAACRSGRNGVQLCLEPLHKSMGQVSSLKSLEEALSIVQAVHSPYLALAVDVCHCFAGNDRSIDFQSLVPWIGTVHLADMTGNDQNQRSFPGQGFLPLPQIISQLITAGYRGDWELEVIREKLIDMPRGLLSWEISHSFALTGRAVICGETALHIYSGNPDHKEPGGSSGMVARQMVELGVYPILIGACGSDIPGQWLSSALGSIAPLEMCQKNRSTSVVKIRPGHPDDIVIRAGNPDPALLAQQMLRLPNRTAYGYLPLFPGYEALLEVTSTRPGWKMIHDFGYYLWCGNREVISQRLAAVRKSEFCALINAKDMTAYDKLVTGKEALDRGYQYALLTDGSKPVLLMDGESGVVKTIPVTPCTEVVDTCGAGDCFTAGVLASLTEGGNMHEAVEKGVETAYRKIQTVGIWRCSCGRIIDESTGQERYQRGESASRVC